MPLLPSLGRTLGTSIKAARLLVRGSVRGGAWATRRVGTARAKGAANETGMIRLFDLHALSCAGDTLIAIGLAGTIFFNVPLGEARSKVALYLLITMVPFALLAPVVGPLLDHFRHGRRYALAATMLGRAFLAYVISDHLFGWGLYPAAFGVLALSRAYGVARSAAVPRLLPEGIGLSQVGARASVYGTFAGAVVAPIGLLAFKFGPQWPLRVAMIIFIVGMVVSLRLPPRADSEPPEAVPRPWRAMLRLGRGEDRPLSGKLVVAALVGSASLRLLYGFMLLFLAFVIMADQLSTTVLGNDIGRRGAVGLIGGALAVGTFVSTAVGTRLRIRRPLALQSTGLAVVAAAGVLTTLFYSLATVTLLALLVAIFSGIAKLAVDASIQERVPERLRASAFAHSETVLMIAWVLGGGIGIIPLPGRLGIALATVLAVLAAARAAYVATRLNNERLSGRADDPTTTDPTSDSTPRFTAGSPAEATSGSPPGPTSGSPARAAAGPNRESGPVRAATTTDRAAPPWSRPSPETSAEPTDPWPEAPTVPTRTRSNNAPPRRSTPPPTQPTRTGRSEPARPAEDGTGGSPARDSRPVSDGPPTRIDSGEPKKSWFGRRKDKRAAAEPPPPRAGQPPVSPRAPIPADQPKPDAALAPPGFHVYRPSSADHPTNGTTSSEDQDR
ncbi:MFS transporter [Paractinoplanes maris]|uniref:MFS transporter n=1 Tax=Paractinoplanes maris TaxID=1734446 RepID=UPI0027DF2F70|nr:MFS transporter [Actinoplanes maris]